MNLLEAWNKANTGQNIILKISKNNDGCFDNSIVIKKEIGSFFKHVLIDKMRELTLETIFSNKWEIKKEKKTGWINLYGSNDEYYTGTTVYETEQEAKRRAGHYYINSIKIGWEE